MARILVKTDAIVLRTRRMGETSKLVTLFTEGHGKLKVTAKGARRPKSKFAGCFETTWQVHIVCSMRDDRDLHTLSDATAGDTRCYQWWYRTPGTAGPCSNPSPRGSNTSNGYSILWLP